MTEYQQQGFDAYFSRKAHDDNPHPAGSAAAAEWDEGWDIGWTAEEDLEAAEWEE